MVKQIYLTVLGPIEKKVQENYSGLTQLDVQLLLPSLYQYDVITQEQMEIIRQKSLKSEKMMYLLNDVILPSVRVGDIEKFQNLLKVFAESEDTTVQAVGRKLGMLNVSW